MFSYGRGGGTPNRKAYNQANPFYGKLWPFRTKNPDDSFSIEWQKQMLLRWTDLESRVTALELDDREYKKLKRRKFTGEKSESEDLNPSVLVPV